MGNLFFLFSMKVIILALVIGVAHSTACELSTNGRCGTAGEGGRYCTPGQYCASWRYCGTGAAWQRHSEQSQYDGNAPCRTRPAVPPVPATFSAMIKNENSQKYIDVAEGRFQDGTNLRQWDRASPQFMENQIYNIVFLSQSTFQIVPRRDQELAFGQNGDSMVVRRRETNAAQGTFSLLASTRVPGTYFIRRADGKCLDVSGGSTWRGADIIFYNCKTQNDPSNANQLWRFENAPPAARRRRLHKKHSNY